MLYFLFEYLEIKYQLPGASLFKYLSFRLNEIRLNLMPMGSIIVNTARGSLIDEKALINALQLGQISAAGLDCYQDEPGGNPEFSKFNNILVIILLFTTLWLGLIGFLDDYIKVFKKNKNGLKGKFKIIGQTLLGLIVGLTLYFHPDVTIKDQSSLNIEEIVEYKSTKTTLPFLKDNEFDYSYLTSWTGHKSNKLNLIVFVFFVILIISSVSNGANLTDGVDGLAAGSSVIISLTLAVFAWISGNIIFSDYLNIMYIPRVSEVVIFISAFIGGLIGFFMV